jgi:hypothetical protein
MDGLDGLLLDCQLVCNMELLMVFNPAAVSAEKRKRHVIHLAAQGNLALEFRDDTCLLPTECERACSPPSLLGLECCFCW